MKWLGLWLIFGMLAAQEFGGLATRTNSASMLWLVYAMLGLLGLGMMVFRSVRRARPSRLYPALCLSVLVPVVFAVAAQRRLIPQDRENTLIAAGGFLVVSAVAMLIGVILSSRRRARIRDRRLMDMHEWDRRRLLEVPPGSPVQQFIDELENPPVEDDADLLPPRPPRS